MNVLVKHVIAALLAILLAVIFYLNSFSLPPAGYQLPRILVVIIILLSVLMVIEEYKNQKKDNKKSKEEGEKEFIEYKRVFIFTALIMAYIFTIKPLGYFIATPIYIIVTYLFLKATSIKNILLIAFSFTIFVYLLFAVLLKLPVPLGLMS